MVNQTLLEETNVGYKWKWEIPGGVRWKEN